MNDPLWVSGYPRTGTTLLKVLLNRHPLAFLHNETDFFFGLTQVGVDLGEPTLTHAGAVLAEAAKVARRLKDHLAHVGVSPTDPRFEKTRSLRSLYAAAAPSQPGTKIWGEKSLNEIFYFRKLSEHFPQSRLLCIVRDPRAVVLSKATKRLASSRGVKTSTIAPAEIPSRGGWVLYVAQQALRWRVWMDQLESLRGDPAFSGRIHCVCYEELVERPERAARRICTFLSIPFDSAMLAHRDRAEDASSGQHAEYAHPLVHGELRPDRIQPHREWNAGLRWIVDRCAGEHLSRWGYAATPRISAGQALGLRARLLLGRGRLRRLLDTYRAQRGLATGALPTAIP